MEHIFRGMIDETFKKLVEEFGFRKIMEIDDGKTYDVKFESGNIVLEIEKYRRDFYTYLYRTDDPSGAVSMYNVLDYVTKGYSRIPQPNYFMEVENLDEYYRMQLEYISNTILVNLQAIIKFFESDNYEEQKNKLREYLKRKHPEWFRTV
jgi:hypothetical protein